MTSVEAILLALKKRLKTKRYDHTLRVIKYAEELADIHKVLVIKYLMRRPFMIL